MLIQLVIGTGLTIATILAASGFWWVLEIIRDRLHAWSLRPPHAPRLIAILAISLFWSLLAMTLAIWIWALAFLALGLFATLEGAVYFSLVAFTTLGFGDVLLDQQWRLLGGFAAANGLLMFGLLTAVLVEAVRTARLNQKGSLS